MAMQFHRGFTLTEMLAVIGIMLVLMVATFGMFSVFAERMGPEAAVSTIQAMLNGARDYAASNGDIIRAARVKFTADTAKLMDGTTMTLQYLPRDGTTQWLDVYTRKPISLRNQVFVCFDLPATLGDEAAPVAADPTTMTPEQMEEKITEWQGFQKRLLDRIGLWALSSGTLKTQNCEFYAVFDPTGYLIVDDEVLKTLGSASSGSMTVTVNAIRNGFTVIQLAAGKVTGYATYPMNPNTGTRLIFE